MSDKKDLITFYEEELENLIEQYSKQDKAHTKTKSELLQMISRMSKELKSEKESSDRYVKIPIQVKNFRILEFTTGGYEDGLRLQIETGSGYFNDYIYFKPNEVNLGKAIASLKDVREKGNTSI